MAKLNDPSMTHLKVYFSDFQRNILEFQMQEHERYLAVFCQHFRFVDKDCDGILNEQEFKALVESLPVQITNEQITYYLQVLDPFNTQKLLFSDIV